MFQVDSNDKKLARSMVAVTRCFSLFSFNGEDAGTVSLKNVLCMRTLLGTEWMA